MAVDVGERRQDPEGLLLLAHFDREEGDRLRLGDVQRPLQGETRLPGAGAPREDDERAALQAASVVIQIREAGGHPRDRLPRGGQRFEDRIDLARHSAPPTPGRRAPPGG